LEFGRALSKSQKTPGYYNYTFAGVEILNGVMSANISRLSFSSGTYFVLPEELLQETEHMIGLTALLISDNFLEATPTEEEEEEAPNIVVSDLIELTIHDHHNGEVLEVSELNQPINITFVNHLPFNPTYYYPYCSFWVQEEKWYLYDWDQWSDSWFEFGGDTTNKPDHEASQNNVDDFYTGWLQWGGFPSPVIDPDEGVTTCSYTHMSIYSLIKHNPIGPPLSYGSLRLWDGLMFVGSILGASSLIVIFELTFITNFCACHASAEERRAKQRQKRRKAWERRKKRQKR
jgi:hypothetical protein